MSSTSFCLAMHKLSEICSIFNNNACKNEKFQAVCCLDADNSMLSINTWSFLTH